MLMALLCPTEITLLNSCRARWVFENSREPDSDVFEFLTNQTGIGISAYNSDKGDLGVEATQQVGDVGRPSQSQFLIINARRMTGAS